MANIIGCERYKSLLQSCVFPVNHYQLLPAFYMKIFKLDVKNAISLHSKSTTKIVEEGLPTRRCSINMGPELLTPGDPNPQQPTRSAIP